MIKNYLFHLLVFVLLLCLATAQVFAQAKLTKARAWKSPDKTRIVFELSKKVKFRVFTLEKPLRLVIDIENAQVSSKTLHTLSKYDLIQKVDTSRQGQRRRVVFYLSYAIRYKAFMLSPRQGYQYRLVIDVFKQKKQARKKNTPAEKQTQKTSSRKKNTKYLQAGHRDLIVAIDAGHGGDDPGAIGRHGTREKHVVLQIAKKLAKKVNAHKGMRAVLIRTGDYYVSLRERTRKARKLNADVFVSIHADAFRNSRARGSSVFILSEKGASSETARWLAAKENAADLAGGVSLDDKDDVLAYVLLDMSKNATIEASDSVARRILKGLKRIGKLHKKQVERAGFVVLKSPDIPSVLVETGFISNPYEERQLKKSSYQQKIANAIFEGIDNYFRRFPIPGTIYGQHISAQILSKQSRSQKQKNAEPVIRPINSKQKKLPATKSRGYFKYKVRRGDSLSKLSKRYGVKIDAIKRLNRMRSDTLRLGTWIKIPRK